MWEKVSAFQPRVRKQLRTQKKPHPNKKQQQETESLAESSLYFLLIAHNIRMYRK